ncbi:MAG: hypothetical protein RSB00_04310 [Bacilli bacterium]
MTKNDYLEIKRMYKDTVVFIEAGKFFRTYGDDAVIMNFVYRFKLVNGMVGFPAEGYKRVASKLYSMGINSSYYAKGTHLDTSLADENNYYETLNNAQLSLRNNNAADKIYTYMKNNINTSDYYEEIIDFLITLKEGKK